MSAELIAREYLRVSYDKSGRQRSNEEQHEDNIDLGELLGFSEFGAPYLDTGSASIHRRRERDDFDRLRADLRVGTFGADILVLWEVSRLSREVDDWPQMLKDCVANRVRIAVQTDARLYDPANATDRKALLNAAVDAEYESAKVSLRTKRSARRAARAGAPHGRIPFGYCRTYDEGRIVQVPQPDEARVVVELFDRIASGDTLAAIAKEFAARGITSRKGIPFAAQTLRGMALAPVYVGRRVHQPGKAARSHRGTDATTTEGTWDRIVPDDMFYAVRRRLTDPARRTVRPGRGIHLLSMLARCDVCGAKLAVTYRKGPRAYQCHGRGCVKVDADDLDGWATRQVLGVLVRDDAAEYLFGSDDDGDVRLSAARGVVERTRAEHADLIAQVAAGALSATLAAGAEPAILARLADAEAALAELRTPEGLDGLITVGPDAAEEWEGKTMAVKREIIRVMFSPASRLGGVLSVAPAAARGESIRARVRVGGKRLGVGGDA